jgi:fructose transport system permease protein
MANDTTSGRQAEAGSSGGTATAPRPIGEADEHGTSLGLRIQHLLHAQPTLGPLAVLLLAVIAFAIINDRFIQASNLSLVVQQVTVIAVLALGQTLIILTAGIDLSTGSIAVLTSMIMGLLASTTGRGYGWPAWLALLVGVGAGTAMGAVNGLLVTRLNLPPFIVTLGTFSVFGASNLLLSKSETIVATDMPGAMSWTGNSIQLGSFPLTYGSILMIVLFVFFLYSLRMTAWGKHVYATGDDVEAARLAGIRTDRVLLSVYTVAGFVYAVGAWVLIGRNGSAAPNVDNGFNLQTITAVVLGGTSLFGGRGSVAGTIVGALIIGTFSSGLSLAGVDPQWQIFAVGVLVIVSVSIDQWIRKVKA